VYLRPVRHVLHAGACGGVAEVQGKPCGVDVVGVVAADQTDRVLAGLCPGKKERERGFSTYEYRLFIACKSQRKISNVALPN
jgi:hypothetical protein